MDHKKLFLNLVRDLIILWFGLSLRRVLIKKISNTRAMLHLRCFNLPVYRYANKVSILAVWSEIGYIKWLSDLK